MEYAIVIEKSARGYGAYVPDLSGCVAVAETEAEVRKLIREGIEIYLEDMRRDGEPIPVPTSRVEYVIVAQAPSAAWRRPARKVRPARAPVRERNPGGCR